MCVNSGSTYRPFINPPLSLGNSMLNLIPVSFCIFVTFRVRVRVRVKVRV